MQIITCASSILSLEFLSCVTNSASSLSHTLSRGFPPSAKTQDSLSSLSRVDDRPPYAALLSLYASIFFPGRPLLRLGRSLAALSLILGSGDAFRQSPLHTPIRLPSPAAFLFRSFLFLPFSFFPGPRKGRLPDQQQKSSLFSVFNSFSVKLFLVPKRTAIILLSFWCDLFLRRLQTCKETPFFLSHLGALPPLLSQLLPASFCPGEGRRRRRSGFFL